MDAETSSPDPMKEGKSDILTGLVIFACGLLVVSGLIGQPRFPWWLEWANPFIFYYSMWAAIGMVISGKIVRNIARRGGHGWSHASDHFLETWGAIPLVPFMLYQGYVGIHWLVSVYM